VEQAAGLPLATPASSGPVAPCPVFPIAPRVLPQQTFAEAVRTEPVPFMSLRLMDIGMVPPLHVREQAAISMVQAIPRFLGPWPLLPVPKG